MEAVFLKIINMSITASWLVLAVIALRFLLKKAPKAFSVILWGLVGIRLILPFSFESVLSLIPSAETVPGDIAYAPIPEIDSGIGAINSAVNPIISGALAPNEISSVSPMETVTLIAACVWVAGIAAMLIYTLISFLLFRRRVREAAPLKDNVYLCDGIATPFILGVIRPRIYLPSGISEADARHVIAHERAHIKRRDHLWKPLGFLLLAVYWFNPVLWIAYILLCRDIELACDEKVIKDKGLEIKKSYSEALVNCSVPRKMIAACPLAFGEGSVKGRIKSVLNYKKPAFWIIIVSIIACVAVAACFLTNPIREKIPENFTVLDIVSSYEDISVSVKEVVLDTENPYIKIKWKNNTKDFIYLGDLYDISYYDFVTGEISSCQKESVISGLIEYIVHSGWSMEMYYSLDEFDLSKDGTYVLSLSVEYNVDNVKEKADFAVVFGIGEGEFEDISISFDENDEPEDYEHRKEVEILDIETDINHDGRTEYLELHSVYNDVGGLDHSILNFIDFNDVIYSEGAAASHSGWNALFLYRKDGQDYLLRYNPYMMQGGATYRYQLFYIAENGAKVVVQENSVSFDINFGSSVHEWSGFDPKAIDEFLNEINALLADSTELINTDQGLIKDFEREGRQYHTPDFWFDYEDWGFTYDPDKSILENLEAYKTAMETHWAEYYGE